LLHPGGATTFVDPEHDGVYDEASDRRVLVEAGAASRVQQTG
jgi:hypothetical protein